MVTIFVSKTFSDYLLQFFTNFFSTPALLIGLFVLLGSIIQRKKVTEIIVSTFKTIIGFLIIGGGAGIIAGAIQKFGWAFQLLFNRGGFLPNNDVMPGLFLSVESLQWIASTGSLILIFSILLNLIIAKISKLKFVYLTGHSAWYFSTMIASVCAVAGIDKQDSWLIVISGSLLVSMWMVISPTLLNRSMTNITQNQQLGLAHTGSLTYLLASEIGNLIHKYKKNIRSTENISFPKCLSLLRNTNVSIALTMLLLLFLIVYFTTWGVRGSQAMIAVGIIKSSDSIFVQGLLQAFTFAAGIEILLIGVRMFIAEIIPAFKGLSNKLLKNVKLAVDCPVVFPFAQNAVMLGFLASISGGIAMFAINIGVSIAVGGNGAKTLTWAAIIIPSIVPHFFTGATAGVFGNAKGGVLGCLIGGFLNGLIIQIIPWIFVGLEMIQVDLAKSGSFLIWGDTDFIIGLFPWIIIKFLGGKYSFLGITLVLWFLIPGLGLLLHFYRLKKNLEYKKLHQEIRLEKSKYSTLIWEKKNNFLLALNLTQKQNIDVKTKRLERRNLKNHHKHEIRNLKNTRENIILQIQKNYLEKKS